MTADHSRDMPYSTTFANDLLCGRTALITGGGSGIGLGIARAMVSVGASVVLVGRREEVVTAAAAELNGIISSLPSTTEAKAVGLAADVRKPATLEKVMASIEDDEQLPPLAVVVNGAAGNFLALAEDLSPNGFATVMGIDALGTFNVCSAALPLLRKGAEALGSPAVVINISATLHKPATWYQSHASAAKAAIDSLTRSLALEWGALGVRVVGIAPGPIAHTPGFAKLGGAAEGVYDAIAKVVPAGRIGQVTDIGHAALFLASGGAEWITGATLVVDGGAVLYSQPIMPRSVVASHARSVEAASRATGLPATKSRL